MNVKELNRQMQQHYRTVYNIFYRQVHIVNRTVLNSTLRRQRINLLVKQLNYRLDQLSQYYNQKLQEILELQAQQSQQTDVVNQNDGAVLIGINYLNTPYELNGCINDTTNINNILIDLGYSSIKLMTDNTTDKPTKDNILSSLKQLINNAPENSNIFFYYSGHGSVIRDINGDERTGEDQVIVPIDENLIVDDELKQLLDTELVNPSVTLIAIFDSCYSGSVLDLKYQYLDTLSSNNIYVNEKVSETKGNVILLSGCSDLQTSVDGVVNDESQGLLTWSFIESIKQNPTNSWKKILINMRELLVNSGGGNSKNSQTPQLSSGRFIDINMQAFYKNK